jgi:uncharacterized membrane protein YedE/YeeE
MTDFTPLASALGGLLIGAGWGLAGFCPGPALANLHRGQLVVVVFVAAMLAGMAIHHVVLGRRGRQAA